ncbi:MAG TPA: hypothetical protein VK629_10175, partial [Steroidobacteraceae bacterium]|nr:hypothetical protein [Steroidobacteraceae bacterium]
FGPVELTLKKSQPIREYVGLALAHAREQLSFFWEAPYESSYTGACAHSTFVNHLFDPYFHDDGFHCDDR